MTETTNETTAMSAEEQQYLTDMQTLLEMDSGKLVQPFIAALSAAMCVIATEVATSPEEADRLIMAHVNTARAKLAQAFQMKELANTIQPQPRAS